jgi:thiamine biosynthesis lipoprotein
MGTVVEIIVADPHKNRAENAIEKAFSEIKRIENLADPIHGYELKRLNNNAGKRPVPVSEELFLIITKAVRYGKLTHGAFDISIAPVLELWGFLGEAKDFSIPESKALSAALHLVDYKDIVLNEHDKTVFFSKAGMKLTLAGIAKGYAVGRAISILQREGINDAIVNAGGDVQVIGDKYGNPWRIGIRHPRKSDEILNAINIKGNKCIFTSGDYERYFVVNNRRYHHIMDPSTGFPTNSSCISVSIICDDPVDADALATSVFVLGPERGMELIDRIPEVEAIMVCEKGKELTIKVSKNIGHYGLDVNSFNL